MAYAFARKLISCSDLSELVIVPDGKVELLGYPSITMDREAADRCIAAFKEQGAELPVDFEHSSVFEAGKGKPAPATAWVKELRYEPGRGLVGILGDRSKEFDVLVESKAYKYLSPVIKQGDDGKINSIHSVALTNKPRIKKQAELLAASQRLTLAEMPDEEKPEEDKNKPQEGDFMTAIKSLAAAMRAKGVQVADDNPETVCNTAMQWMVSQQQTAPQAVAYSEVLASLGLKPDADKALVLSEVEKLRGHVGFVPATEFKALSDRLGVLEAEKTAARVESAITKVLSEGKLNPNDENRMKWARDFATRDVDGFLAIMSDAPVIRPVGRVTPEAGSTTKDGMAGDVTRDRVVALSSREWSDNAMCQRMATREEWINQGLREHGFAKLTAAESAKN